MGPTTNASSTPVPRTPDWFALVSVVVTAVLHLILQAGGPNPFFIVGACVFWTCYVVVRARREPEILRYWGFRADNLLSASVIPAILFLAGSLALGCFAWWHGRLWFPKHTLFLFVLYPFWGVAQQFLTLGIAVRNMELIPTLGRNRPVVILLGGMLFASVHLPDAWVVVSTFGLELIVVPLYLRYRNLWPLGVMHGWLGVFFYLWGMGRDMWVENFGQFF